MHRGPILKTTLFLAFLCLTPLAVLRAQLEPAPPDISVTPGTVAVDPDAAERNFLKELVSPRAFLLDTIPGAVISQWHKFPKEWGTGRVAFEKRLASQYGQFLTGELVEFGVKAIHEEHTRYIRRGKGTFFGRMGYVIASTVVGRKNDGTPTFAISNPASAYGGWALATLWNPKSERTAGSVFGWGTANMGMIGAGHLVKEFWPDVKSVFRRKK